MVNQQIFLPMIPDSAPIVINISQYDFDAADYAGRLFFNLVSDGAAYDMDGATAIFQGEKPDGTTFAYPATVVNASVVRVNVRQQMTAAAGRVVCSLILSNHDGQIGSFNVWLEVQPSSAAGGDPSQTDIPALIALARQYAEIAEQAADSTAAWAANPPYIGANGNWFVYDADLEQYTDTGVYASGTEGNKWYSGTAISGKDPTPTVYPTGITLAREGDMYLNKTEGAIYQCTLGGAASVAKWAYVMTLTGGGGGGTSDYTDLDNKPQVNGVILTGNKTTGDLIPLGNGLGFDSVTLKLFAKLVEGSNITLTPQADGSIMISASGGGSGSLDDLTDVDITTPVAGQILEYDGTDWVNGDNIKEFARYGGSKTFAQLDSSLLTAANVDKFFLVTDGGTIASADASNWLLPAGSVIPADSHIAVIEYSAGVYKFDDFGGYIDISGKADKSELDDYIADANVSGGSITFRGIDDTVNSGQCGYKVYFDITSNSVNLNPTAELTTISGEGTNNMTLVYTTDADNGTNTAHLRQIK